MKNIKRIAALVAVTAVSSACTIVPIDHNEPAPTSLLPAQKVLAVGYGAMGPNSPQVTIGQQRLMAMRAARIDAYRNLVEQVYGFRLSGGTAVASFATQNDNVRIYVDAVIRGARIVNVTSINDGNYEAAAELELTPAFFGCVSNYAQANCGAAIAPADTARLSAPTYAMSPGAPATPTAHGDCSAAGCVQPSRYYYTSP